MLVQTPSIKPRTQEAQQLIESQQKAAQASQEASKVRQLQEELKILRQRLEKEGTDDTKLRQVRSQFPSRNLQFLRLSLWSCIKFLSECVKLQSYQSMSAHLET